MRWVFLILSYAVIAVSLEVIRNKLDIPPIKFPKRALTSSWYHVICILLLCYLLDLLFPGTGNTSWDDFTYHLYFHIRWIHEHGIFIIPTPFGDNAPAYFPCNTELIYSLVMISSKTSYVLYTVPFFYLLFLLLELIIG